MYEMKRNRWFRFFACFVAVMVPLLSMQVSLASASGSDYITVGLKYAGTAVSSCSISSEEGFVFGTGDKNGFDESEDLSDYTELTVKAEGGEPVLYDSDGEILDWIVFETDSCLMPADYEDDGITTIDGKNYRGGLRFLEKDNKLTVINYLKTEQYVRGVVSKEIGYGCGIEALKAQAVAARSFAEANRGKHAASGFELCATTHCQVYGGVSAEYDSTNRAVKETAGECITYNGRIVEANFFASSGGGYTRNAKDVWGGTSGYLLGVKDDYTPEYPWTADFTYEQVASKLAALGSSYNCGTISDVAITGRDQFGYVTEMTFTGSDGTSVVKGENCRTMLGLKSCFFEIVGQQDSPSQTISSTKLYITTLRSASGNSSAGTGTVSVLSSSGNVVRSLSDLYVQSSSGVTKGSETATTITSASSGGSSGAATPGHLVLKGSGYGHMVGMSQNGAIEMAKQGFTYDEILKYYYTGIEVE